VMGLKGWVGRVVTEVYVRCLGGTHGKFSFYLRFNFVGTVILMLVYNSRFAHRSYYCVDCSYLY